MIKKSPFKFLDSYTLADRAEFFGRDQEIEALYELIFKSRLILVYGNSGTGKTSLIQCGLASKFDGPDWFPFWIRKNGDINASLRSAINEALDSNFNGTIKEAVERLFNIYLRPVYLIFDQFEELFILGTKEEQLRFVEEIQLLFEAELPCKIIFVMREEYLGSLYEFEKNIPAIFDHRLRIESMNNAKVKEVIAASFAKFNITLEGDADQRMEEMIANISGEKSGIQLPYLQVYLDLLYREDYKKTYGHAPDGAVEALPPLQFSHKEIAEMGQIQDVLQKFLDEQQVLISSNLKKDYPDLPDMAIHQMLDVFVTEEGTKRPLYFKRDGQQFKLDERYQYLLPDVPEEMISKGLESLENSRLVRFTDHTIELAHDSLAALIDQKRTNEQRQLNAILRQLNSAYDGFGKTGEFLSAKQLAVYEDYIPKLRLEPEIIDYIQQSKDNAGAIAKAEKERQQRELELAQQKLANQKKSARYQRILFYIIILVAVIMIYNGYLFLDKIQREKEYLEDIGQERRERLLEVTLSTGDILKLEGKYQLAIEQLERVANTIGTKEDSLTIINEINNIKSLDILTIKADSLRIEEKTWNEALIAYQEAMTIDSSNILRSRMESLQKEIDEKFSNYMKGAAAIKRYRPNNYCRFALESYYSALQLKPNDPEVRQAVLDCGGELNQPNPENE